MFTKFAALDYGENDLVPTIGYSYALLART